MSVSKSPSLVVGFDVSSTRTGYSVIKSGRFYIAKHNYGTIEPPKEKTLSEKLVFFRKAVIGIFEDLPYPPTTVAVEDVFVGQISSAIILSRFSGVLLETIREVLCLEPVLLTVTHARKILGFPNNKEQVFELVKKKFRAKDWSFRTHNDIADSVVIGLAAYKESTQ